VVACGLAAWPLSAAAPTAAVGRGHEAFFQANCLKCHAADRQEGQVRLDDLPFELTNVETAERWQKVLGVLNSGEMPPEDEPRPDEKAKTDLLAELSDALVVARKSIGDQGRVGVLRRLNRREYVNTIRDLFGIETTAEGLPEDKGTGVFDTVGAALFMSSDQLDRYVAIGRAVATEAVTAMRGVAQPAERKTSRRETEVEYHKFHANIIRGHLDTMNRIKEWQEAGSKADALPRGFNAVHEIDYTLTHSPRGYNFSSTCLALPNTTTGSYLIHAGYGWGNELVTIPTDAPPGRYVIRLRTGTNDKPRIPRFIELGYLEDGDRNRPKVIEARDIPGTVGRPELVEFTIPIGPGSPRNYFLREKRYGDRMADHFKYNREIDHGNGIGTIPAIWIDWIEWDGPILDPAIADRRLQLLGSAEADENDPAVVRSILERFATRAFRGVKPKASFVDRLVAVHQARRAAGADFLCALVEPLAIVLAAPRFLYLNEPLAPQPQAGSDAEAAAGKLLSNLELASRLAYFLWASPPDETLIAAARSGDLRKPDALAAHVDRMIADPKAIAFSTGFAHQWLLLDRLDLFQFDYKNYPKFDESTRAAAKGEVYHTFHTLLTENLDARKLLAADFVVVNAVMADYYGLTDNGKPVTGMTYRTVALPEKSPRGGLLGMACILGMGSNGVISSPVERGAWVLRKLLDDPPPPAPANVPQLSRLDEEKLTARERLYAHQEQAQCKQCHRRIDPIGFGLENFDAAGMWRDVDTYKPGEYLRRGPDGALMVATYPIEPAGAFHNGPAFKDYFELRDLIAARGDDFLRGLIENLYEYALGRPTSFADAEAIDGLLVAAKAYGGGLKSIVKQIVATPEFQTK
jgi:hypothetical protein